MKSIGGKRYGKLLNMVNELIKNGQFEEHEKDWLMDMFHAGDFSVLYIDRDKRTEEN